MRTIASEIEASEQTVTTLEFLGTTFAERREAVAKASAFVELTKKALVDSAEVMVGSRVHAVFKPSMALLRQYNAWVPCYSISDEIRKPWECDVDIISVSESGHSMSLGFGEKRDDRYDTEWVVGLNNIINIGPIETEA